MKLTRRQKGLLGILFIIAMIILSWIGLAKYFPESNVLRYIPDRIYRIIKIVFGGDPSASSLEPDHVPWELILVKIGSIFILLFGAYKIIQKVFSEQLNLLKASFKNRHTISVGISKKGKQLLHSVKKDQQEKAIAIEKELEHVNSSSIKKEGHLLINGNAEDEHTLMEAGIRRASRLIVFLENEQTVIEIVQKVQEILKKKPSDQLLKCYIHLRNPRLVDLLKNAGLRFERSNIELHFFNIHKMVARSFFNRIPHLVREHGMDLKPLKQLVFIGYSDYAKALMIQAFRILHFDPQQDFRILVFSNNAAAEQLIFEEQFPKAHHIFEYSFVPFQGSFNSIFQESGLLEQGNRSLVIHADADDQTNLNLSLEMLDRTKGQDFPIFCLNTEGDGLRSLIAQEEELKRIQFFGNMEETCNIEFITGEKQDRLAQAIHDDYRKLLAGTESESASYTSDWLTLSEDAKDASRTQADHIIYKFLLTGKPLVDPDPSSLDFEGDDLETLAMIEHNRWMAHRYIQGWDFGEVRDDQLKLHPSMIPWDILSESERQKDRDTVLRLKELMKV